jgi:hypothetical protein
MQRSTFWGGVGYSVGNFQQKNLVSGEFWCPHPHAKILELYPDLVFRYGIGWYFLGIFLTDTEGKLGKDLWYRTYISREPLFHSILPSF